MVLMLLACAEPELTLNVPESPLSGQVELSASGNFEQLLILVDGNSLGGGPGPGLTLTWDTTSVEEGAHVVRAQGFIGARAPVEVVEDVVVDPTAWDTEAPVVRFLEPDQELDAGLQLVALDIEDESPLASVDLRVDGELLASLPVDGPWEVEWEAQAGEHTLSAAVVDEAGNTGVAELDVEVLSAGMTCVLTRPQDEVVPPEVLELRAAVTSEAGLVSTVTFYADSVLVFEDTQSPWSTEWDAGAYALDEQVELRVVGADNAGNSCEDTLVVTIGEADPVELSVRITAPADGSAVSGAAMPVQVAAQSENGIQSVACTAGGVEQGTLTQAPWKFHVDTTAFDNGPLTVEVIATELGTGEQATDSVDLIVDN